MGSLSPEFCLFFKVTEADNGSYECEISTSFGGAKVTFVIDIRELFY